MKMNYKKGFTLIELLVVIAIIGILSSVVLASLNTARDKGANAAAKSNLNNMRAQAELFYDGTGNGKYTGICTEPTVASAIAAAAKATGDTAICGSTDAAWGAEVKLKGGGYYCVDSRGVASTTSATLITTGSNPSAASTTVDCQ